MLPLPHVKSLNIPTPEFNHSFDINLTIPTPELNTKFPNVEVLGVELKAPFVPSLSELELDRCDRHSIDDDSSQSLLIRRQEQHSSLRRLTLLREIRVELSCSFFG